MEYLWPIAAYLIGSMPAAIVVTKLLGLPDPRTTGSANPGATNVLRYGGKIAAGLTLAGDLGKGVLAVALVRWFAPDPLVVSLAGLAVFLGHLYPVFFGFSGGKGVATALGVWLVLVPIVGGLLFATWLTVAAVFRYSSLAALVAALLAPLFIWWFASHGVYIALGAVMSLLLLWRHRTNIGNLLAGTETRIGAKPRSAADH